MLMFWLQYIDFQLVTQFSLFTILVKCIKKLVSWIRMRLRAMMQKRKNYNDNRRISVKHFCQKLGFLTLEQFCTYKDENGETRRVITRNVAT